MWRRTESNGRGLAATAWLLFTLACAGACGTTTSRSSGETHFLSFCSEECGDGFECLCGVCTQSCANDAACGDVAPGASCSEVLGGTCGGNESICDVECQDDGDCAELGADHVCRGGSCREGSPAPQPDVACPDDCNVLYGYPEDKLRGCVDLDARLEGDDGWGIPVACSCDEELHYAMGCRVREADNTLWLLPLNELRDADAWHDCSSGQSERMRASCDFAHCEPDRRPPSTCDFETTCTTLTCGASQIGEDGCQRTRCESDDDCGEDQYCGALYEQFIQAFIGPQGTCGFGGNAGAILANFCRDLDDVGPLCDGTDEVRVVVSTDGGQVASEHPFTNPFGHSFLAVDGNCNYWAGVGDHGELRSGTFTEQEAAELEASLGWPISSEWSDYSDPGGCPDGDVTGIYTKFNAASCDCGCDSDAPQGLNQALVDGSVLARELALQGQLLSGPVRVVTMPLEDASVPAEDLVEWPDPRDPSEFAIEPYYFEIDSGLTVSDGDLASLFRELRDRDGGQAYGMAAGSVEGSDGTQYMFWVRDELPENVFAELVSLL